MYSRARLFFAVFLAFALESPTAASTIVDSNAIIEMTTNNSIRVKPREEFRAILTERLGGVEVLSVSNSRYVVFIILLQERVLALADQLDVFCELVGVAVFVHYDVTRRSGTYEYDRQC